LQEKIKENNLLDHDYAKNDLQFDENNNDENVNSSQDKQQGIQGVDVNKYKDFMSKSVLPKKK